MALLDDILRLFGTNRTRLRWRWRVLAERMTPRPPRKDAYKFDNKLSAGCGQPAGKDEKACPSCGTPLPAIAVVRATRAIRWLIPAGVPVATMLLLAACGALYFVTVKASFAFLGDAAGRSFAPHWWILLRYGATEGGHLSQLGEWWRTVTACFLHFDALHILFNGIGLWIAGQVVEERFGWARALVVFVATGVAGNLVSAWWRIDRGVARDVVLERALGEAELVVIEAHHVRRPFDADLLHAREQRLLLALMVRLGM